MHRFYPTETQLLTGIHRTLLVSKGGLEEAKNLVSQYKQGKVSTMTPELWKAKKIVDSTLHPGTQPFP